MQPLGDALDELMSLTQSERRTIRIIAEYYAERGYRCFTYRGLQAHYTRNKHYNSIHWHTVERSIRRLAESNLLHRHYRGRRNVLFCISRRLMEIVEALGWARRRGSQ